MRALRAVAPAKLNLYLHVTGRRADGYHLLDSLIAFADASDIVSVQPAPELSLSVDGPFAAALGDVDDNLVLQAARHLAAVANVEPRAAIQLTKHLPVSAGLGGGSTDAAAALRLLGSLWNVRLERASLEAIDLALGADVAICRHGRAAFVSGIGERIDPVFSLPTGHLVLVNPGLPLRTVDVYAGYTGRFAATARFEIPENLSELSQLLAARQNDLTESAVALRPEVQVGLSGLRSTQGCLLARMCGSGPTCYGLFADGVGARQAAATFAAQNPGWWVTVSRLLSDAREIDAGPV